MDGWIVKGHTPDNLQQIYNRQYNRFLNLQQFITDSSIFWRSYERLFDEVLTWLLDLFFCKFKFSGAIVLIETNLYVSLSFVLGAASKAMHVTHERPVCKMQGFFICWNLQNLRDFLIFELLVIFQVFTKEIFPFPYGLRMLLIPFAVHHYYGLHICGVVLSGTCAVQCFLQNLLVYPYSISCWLKKPFLSNHRDTYPWRVSGITWTSAKGRCQEVRFQLWYIIINWSITELACCTVS